MHLKNQEAETACMLPNVARYQLRHTPKYSVFLNESNSGNMREKIAQGVKLKNHAMLGFRKVPKGKKLQKSFGLLAVCRMFPFRREFRVGFSTARRKRQRFF